MRTIALFLLFLCCSLMAQQNSPIVKITTETTSKKEVIFWAENQVYVPCTVTLQIGSVGNTHSVVNGETIERVVSYGRHRILTLRPIDSSRNVTYSFKTRSIQGDMKAIPDTAFIYLFPLKEGKELECRFMNSVSNLADREMGNFKYAGMAFPTVEGDTIVAARGGIVSRVEDQQASSTEGRAFSASENFVEICHKDGSFAVYKLFQDKSIFVRPGDTVFPGQPLGIIGGANYQNGSHLRFSVYRWGKSPETKGNTTNRLSSESWLPLFWLGDSGSGYPERRQTYTVHHPEELITAEMNKKEKKNYQSSSAR